MKCNFDCFNCKFKDCKNDSQKSANIIENRANKHIKDTPKNLFATNGTRKNNLFMI